MFSQPFFYHRNNALIISEIRAKDYSNFSTVTFSRSGYDGGNVLTHVAPELQKIRQDENFFYPAGRQAINGLRNGRRRDVKVRQRNAGKVLVRSQTARRLFHGRLKSGRLATMTDEKRRFFWTVECH